MKEDERSEERTEGEREEEKGERERESIGDICKIGESQVKMACLCFLPRYRARCEYLVKCNVNNC